LIDLIAEATSYPGLARSNAVEGFELLRECCRTFGGKEVRTMGDVFFPAFAAPEQAARCAAGIQQRFATHFPTIRAILVLRLIPRLCCAVPLVRD